MTEPKAREFWIVSEYGAPPYIEYDKREVKDGYSIHVREVTGPDYKEIAEGLMGAMKFYAYESLDITSIDINGDGKPLQATKFGVDRGQKARAAIEAARLKGMTGE